MSATPILLVPGFWLGAWAWDEVAATLRDNGHDVTALTLPGLESIESDRSSITFDDHVNAIVDAVKAAGRPVVLAVHSGTGYAGYAASDRVPDRIATMIYVDSAPAKGAMDADFADVDLPIPDPKKLAEDENLDGLSEEQLAEFRRRAVPQPGGVLRGSAELTNDARLDIPSVVICTGYPSDEVKSYIGKMSWLAGLTELRNVTWLDLPTSHWPMWSRPQELAALIDDVAKGASGT
jgi:pimeloyl-ACP methyl ester carboxylesterase